jgi:hypothetical protein
LIETTASPGVRRLESVTLIGQSTAAAVVA